MSKYQHQMVSLTLLPGDKGIFDVKVDAVLVFSKFEVDRFPFLGEVSATIKRKEECC